MGKRSESKKKQKAREIFEHQVKPGLPKRAQEIAEINVVMYQGVIDPRAHAALKRIKGKVAKLQGRLHDPTVKAESGVLFDSLVQKKTDTAARRPPNAYYVIVGLGAAAVVNHTTLRQSVAGKARLGNLPVMHIGFNDPWLSYHPHGMGQPPFLLRMPGYHRPVSVNAATIRSGCHSRVFAKSTQSELDMLTTKFETYREKAWVAVIQSRGDHLVAWVPSAEWGEFPALRDNIAVRWMDAWPGLPPALPYRLIVVRPDESIEIVYAEKIDICCGLGRASVQAGAPHHTVNATAPALMLQEMRDAAPLLWLPPDMWDNAIRNRAILTGPEALLEQTVWSADHRIYVNGGGGIGLNMIERAEDVGCYADWLHYRTLHDTFNLERNDTVLKDPLVGGPRAPGTSGLRAADASLLNPMPLNLQNLIPCRSRWRFGRNGNLPTYTGVSRMGAELMVVIAANVNSRIHDYNDDHQSIGETLNLNGAFPFSVYYQGVNAGLIPQWGIDGRYNRVLCTGGINGNSLGAAQQLSTGLVFQALNGNGRVVGMETADHNIRILGAATFGYPNFPALVGGGLSATRTYFESLPVSAVPPGFIFSGINIAEANGWFANHTNVNVNTATRAEIANDLDAKGASPIDADTIARAIVDLRRRVNGFVTPAAVIQAFLAEALKPLAVGSVLAAMLIPTWQVIVMTATTEYRDGEPL